MGVYCWSSSGYRIQLLFWNPFGSQLWIPTTNSLELFLEAIAVSFGFLNPLWNLEYFWSQYWRPAAVPLDFFLEFIGPVPCQTSVLKAGHGFGILFGGWNLFGLSTGDLLLRHPLWSVESLWD